MMKRSSTHILKYQTLNKTNYLKQLFVDFKLDLEQCIDKIISGELELEKFGSFEGIIKHSRWKQIVYKNASEIIRSQISKANSKRYIKYKKLFAKCIKNNKHISFTNKRFSELKLKNILQSKYFSKPNLKNLTITIDDRVLDFKKGNCFDEFVQINLPYFQENKKRAIKLRLPIKQHKHSLRFKDWNRCKSVRLRQINNQFYLDFIYEKEEPTKVNSGNILGIDQGYKKLISDSNGKFYQGNLSNIYNKLARKKQGSKNFKQTLVHRTNEMNRVINEFFKQNEQLRMIFIEDLKDIKKHSKIYRKVMNKVQRWLYSNVINKLERFTEENGVQLVKVNPAYTSQTCSKCGTVDKSSRSGEWFHCQYCNLEIDADFNAAINIYNRGVYNLSDPKSKLMECFSI